jgi:hypothetical protein
MLGKVILASKFGAFHLAGEASFILTVLAKEKQKQVKQFHAVNIQ